MRQYACGHADVGERLRHCDFMRLHNKDCNRFALAPEDITIETEECAACREGNTSLDVNDQDSAHLNAVSLPVLGLEARGRSSGDKNPKPFPPLIGECDVPGEGPTLFYEDGITRKQAWVDAHWSLKKALSPRKLLGISCPTCQSRKIRCDLAEPKCGFCSTRSRDCWLPITGPRNLGDESVKLTQEVEKSRRPAIACTACREKKIKCDPAEPKCIQCAKCGRDCRWPTSGLRRLNDGSLKLTKEVGKSSGLAIACLACLEKKIKCDPAEPKCVQCAKYGRVCRWPTLGPRNFDDGPLKLTEEVQKPERARLFNSEQSLNDKSPRRPFPKDPSLFARPDTSKTAAARTHPVPILAHNLLASPPSREYLPGWVPQQTKHGQLTDGSLSAAFLQPLRTHGAVPLRTLLARYYLLDRISQVKIDKVKACLDAVNAERPVRSLDESIALLYAKPPKPWLAIRRMIQDDNIVVLNSISDAKFQTDYVLSHILLEPYQALFDCIRVRQYMLNMLFRELRVFLLGEHSVEKRYSPAHLLSDHQSSAKSVRTEGSNQAARNSKRRLQTSSQRSLDRILHPAIQGKPRIRAVNALD